MAGANTSFLILCIAGAILLVSFVFLASAIRIVPEYQRVVVFRFGRALPQPMGPGLVFLLPLIDKAISVDLREQVREVQQKTALTRDEVSLSVKMVWYFKVVDPLESILKVGNYENFVMETVTRTLNDTLRNYSFKDVMNRRDEINKLLVTDATRETLRCGVQVLSVEIREVASPSGVER